MANDVHFIERRKKPWGRSASEIVIAIAAVVGLLVSVFTGVRAFMVNEYRIDVLELTVKETKSEVKEARNEIQDLDRSVQRLVGAATKQGWVEEPRRKETR